MATYKIHVCDGREYNVEVDADTLSEAVAQVQDSDDPYRDFAVEKVDYEIADVYPAEGQEEDRKTAEEPDPEEEEAEEEETSEEPTEEDEQ